MKRLSIILTSLCVLAVGCQEFDDSEIWSDLDDLKTRITALEKLCKDMNADIENLNALVKALQTRDYITDVTPVVGADGIISGYIISFAINAPITICHGQDGEDGQDGADGSDGLDVSAPKICVMLDYTDGTYYWTIDGEWLKDEDGKKIKAYDQDAPEPKDGVTPQLKIEDEIWYVSYDNGGSWIPWGKATGEQGSQGETGVQGPQGEKGESGDSVFAAVDYTSDPDYVTFTLSDGTQLRIPTWFSFEALKQMCETMNMNLVALQTIVTALEDRDYITDIKALYDGTTEIGYTLTFSRSGNVTIFHGSNGLNGDDGSDGKDGVTPVIGVRQDIDGVYYWTVNGEWLLDDSGEKARASAKDGMDGDDSSPGEDGEDGVDGKDGLTPQLKIEAGKWWVSYDEGNSWIEFGPATGEQGEQGDRGERGEHGDPIFSSVTQDEKYVYLFLSDGSQIALPKCPPCPVTVTVEEVGESTAVFDIEIHRHSLDLKVTLYLSTSPDMTVYNTYGISLTDFGRDHWSYIFTGLSSWTAYYYFVEVRCEGKTYFSEVGSFFTNPYAGAVSLSDTGTANSYIVSEKGTYCISAVKGNGNESVGPIASAEVLWETFGTNATPHKGDLIKSSVYNDGKIYFQTSDTYREGNAVIAAKDASGTILWSWHIWLTDQPKEQVYYNDAGIFMDRNLGATSATPGDVGALGLMYQWGRKDPFLCSSSIGGSVEAKSTITWPSSVASDSSTGTIQYVTEHPTTFVKDDYDWLHSSDYNAGNPRWTTSESPKSVYDPCPAGWRVPDGGSQGGWCKALGSSSSYYDSYNSSKHGIDFSGRFGASSTLWYPASGVRERVDGSLGYVAVHGLYWSASSASRTKAYRLYFHKYSYVNASESDPCSYGYAIRCCREE